ncbi:MULTISPECIES: dipeptidase [Gammaproteobacteria]|uniref:dipeptidase n=1 Tax=Gammaproteobacteria TaxID=1236 RepID=UPI000DCFA631|nr:MULTISPECIES: dipeptidase [Gammaproteobacteria]RTE87658.1 membrane dipeptidase [Aliidiomarina sp. B3213]TCZ92558.1 membrane dipeptidase [Lysobacter sp. N42]
MKTALKISVLSALSFSLLGCAQTMSVAEEDNRQKAERIAQESLIIDTHIDVPWRLMNDWEDVTQATERGNFDYVRATQGGLNAPFMAIYIPASYEDNGAYRTANHLIDFVESLVYKAPEKFAIPYSADDVEEHFEQGLISLPMGMENGAPIEGKFENLQHFFDRGVRYITLTHSEDNHISDSSYDIRNTWGGLSPFGKTLIPEMNKVGMMIDISHVSDNAFYDVLEITETPVIATHSSARRYTPGWQRNMNDDMIKALAENGGVIQVTFGSTFVTRMANQHRARLQRLADEINEELGEGTEEAEAAIAQMREENPFPYANLDDVLNHIDHIVELVGIDHVGIGSDYDGVGDSLPEGLKDVSTFPNLIEGLLERGYSEEQIDQILHGNTLRVWRQVEAYAEAH